jgi:hypothetical protein
METKKIKLITIMIITSIKLIIIKIMITITVVHKIYLPNKK